MTTKDTVLAAINKVATHIYISGILFHPYRGVLYASKATRNTLKSYQMIQSIAESFFMSLETKLIYVSKLIGVKQMKNKIFEYIEIWYRKLRRHSYLGYQTIKELNDEYQKQNMNNVA